MASLIIHNAHLLSFHEGFKGNANDAIAIDGNRIKAIGRWDELKAFVQPNTQIVDAAGKTLMPGFNDTHIHIWKVGNLSTYMLDVRTASSLDEMLTMLETYHQQNPDVAWITARGFNEAGWKDGRMPTKHDLDKIIKDKPVYVIRTCAHIAVANSKALEMCQVTAQTSVPNGGVMELGADGKPNGIFSETALGIISKHIPPYTKHELKRMIKAAREQLYSYGITAATDPAVHPLLLDAYYEMERSNELGFRLNAIPILLPDGGEKPHDLPEYYSSNWFNINTVKFFSDGGLSGKTAALKRYYKNTKEQGILRLQKQQYMQLGMAAMEKGLGLATHAIGDAAIDFVVDCYCQLDKLFPNTIKRIEHLGLPEEQHLEQMAAHHIAVSMQSVFISELGKNFIKYLDDDYLDNCYPIKAVLQQGILTALSSDAPVVSDFNPLKGVEAAVTRKDNEGNSIAPQQAIGIAEALKAYTVSSSAISKTLDFGTLQIGQLADFILLDNNPLNTNPATITDIKVTQTYVDGNCVWERA